MDPTPYRLSFFDATLVTQGWGGYWIDDTLHQVSPGDVIFTGPGCVRRSFVTELCGIAVFFERSFLRASHEKEVSSVTPDQGIYRATNEQFEDLSDQFRSLLATNGEPFRGSSAVARARVGLILALLADAGRVRKEGSSNKTSTRLSALVEQHFAEQHAPAFYAKTLGVSVPRLSEICRRERGETTQTIIHKRLIEEANRSLLHSTMSIQEVGYSLGFDNPSHFTKFFKRHSGQSPRQYREARRAELWR